MKEIVQGYEERVGHVVMRRLVPKTQRDRMYSDGYGETSLFDFIAGARGGEISEDEARRNPIWEAHLSPVRHNLLKWFPFEPSGKLLDIGAGCGALTGLFTSRLAQVTALEFNPQRAHITALRYQRASNLEVLVGGLQDLETDRRFRYVNITGVLEYASTFFGGQEPHLSFLERAASFLETDGELIISIENKLGLKVPDRRSGRSYRLDF